MSDPTGGMGDAPAGDWLAKTDPSTLPSANDILEGQIEQAVRHERDRQIAQGYGPEHDDRHGAARLIEFAHQFARNGMLIKALAMHAAAADVERRQADRAAAHRAAADARDAERIAKVFLSCASHDDGRHVFESVPSGRGVGMDSECTCGAIENWRPIT